MAVLGLTSLVWALDFHAHFVITWCSVPLDSSKGKLIQYLSSGVSSSSVGNIVFLSGWVVVGVLISLLLLLVSVFSLFSAWYKYASDTSIFECGFLPYLTTHKVFSIHFYRVAILFILFDIELSILLPYCERNVFTLLISSHSTWIFLMVLSVGFVCELASNSLSVSNNVR